MTRAREAARLIGNNTFRLDSNNAVGFNSTTPDAMFDINRGLTVAGVSTFTGNVTMSGDLTVQGTTTTLDTVVQEVDLMNIQANSSTPGLGVTQSGAGDIVRFFDGTTAVFNIDGGGMINIPLDGTASTGRLRIGAGQDLQIYHDGSNSYITNSTGILYIDGDADDLVLQAGDDVRIQVQGNENAVRCEGNGPVELYYDASQKLTTASYGIDVTGEVQCDSLDVDGVADITGLVSVHNSLHLEADDDKLVMGTGDDFEVYHDGSTNIINGRFHPIEIRHAAEVHIKCVDDGTVELYHNNSKKLETTSTGVTVTGDVNSTSDINLKKDIEVVDSSTEMLNQLRGVKFTWKENDEKSVGVIAQEVEAILPELVKGEEGDKSVNYSGLVGVLIEAVKELSARVEELENK